MMYLIEDQSKVKLDDWIIEEEDEYNGQKV